MSTSAETSNITTSNDTTNNDIIIPPPDIRAVVNKTAQFVAKNGRQFESRILSSSEGSTPKFAFMSTSSPYNPYYESRIIFFNNGGDIEEEQNIIQRNREEDERALEEASRPTSQTVTVTVVDEVKVDRATVDVVGRAILKARKVDAMKLSAQFTAACGTKFMVGLSRKEATNPLFEFLKPSSKNFAYFTALVDSYQKVIRPSAGEVERVGKLSTVPGMLSTVALRKEYRREMRVRRMEEEGGGVRLAVDWHDFVIVETVEFEDGEAGGGGQDEGDGMDMDESESEDEAMEPLPADADIKVVADYKPRVDTGTAGGAKSGTMVDPITGERVKVDEMSEHMRIQLMDPKWREQNARFQSKLGSTNVASGESIVANLKAFSEERRDIFGSSVDREMERRMEERERGEEARRILDKYKDTGKEVATVQGPPRPDQQGRQTQANQQQMQSQMQSQMQNQQASAPTPQQQQQQLAPVPPPPAPQQQQQRAQAFSGGPARDSSMRRGVSNLPAWMKNQPGVLPNPSEVNAPAAPGAGEVGGAGTAAGGSAAIVTLRGRSTIMSGRTREDTEEQEERERKKRKA
ncbi:hypothetical protein TrRE_jg10060 [Triparma retinervis]|uniref:SURP motif domain-containing protein n=1 Tax=Triparma retinervis TaxID=2557542 RepID=A0A9W7CAP6_9STRA|nr:hypothetical protein TrRE_jg10060 [Triparma retinervis]